MIEQLEPQAILDLFAAHNRVTLTQSLPVVLTIDVQDFVEYRQDVSDPATFATNPNVTSAATLHNFFAVTMLADIVALNGQPVKGLYVGRPRAIDSTPTPAPGQAVADVTHNSFRDLFFEILQSDGTPIGSIAATGLAGGNAPPGAPSVLQGSNWAIIGGTGAFLGARGQAGSAAGNSPRGASISEDPSKRRINYRGQRTPGGTCQAPEQRSREKLPFAGGESIDGQRAAIASIEFNAESFGINLERSNKAAFP